MKQLILTILLCSTIVFAQETNLLPYNYLKHRPVPTSGATPPAAPVADAATGVLETQFTANWTAGDALQTGFALDVATDVGFTSYVAGFEDLDVGDVVTYDVTGLTASTDYHYRVRAYNGDGISANSNVVDVITAAPFSPADLDSMTLWLTPASQWNDFEWGDTASTGYASNVLYMKKQAGTFQRTTSVNLGAGAYNFFHTNNATDTWMISPTSTAVAYANYNNFTIFFVDSIKSGGTYQQLGGITADAGNNSLIFLRTDNTEKLNLFTRDVNGIAGVNIVNDSVVTGKWGIHVFQWSGQTLTGQIVVSGDSTGVLNANSGFLKGQTWATFNELGLFGAWYNFGLNGGLNGGIAEVIAYRGYLTITQINQVANYLSAKYGLVWNTSFQ